MTGAERVGAWRRRLQLAIALRAVLLALGVSALVFAAGERWGAARWPLTAFGALAGVLLAGIVWWRAGGPSLTPRRAALWLEERTPALRYALVTAVDPDTTPAVRGAVERAAQGLAWERAAGHALRRALRLPAAVALAGTLAAIVALAAPPANLRRATVRPAGAASASTRGALPALGTLEVRVDPPAYTGLAGERSTDPALVRAYPGSRLVVRGTTDTIALRAWRDSAALPVAARATGWEVSAATGTVRALFRVARVGGEGRLIALEPRLDSTPVVTLRLPARDTVLRTPAGTLALSADVHDDLGLASAAFEYIVSSGEGERFTFRSGTLGALSPGATARGTPAGARSATISASLSLEALGIAPGDVVHLRAVARDRNAVTGPGVGSSDTRTIRVARAGEYDSVAVEQAPPPEIDKSVLSQRMLINMTEALVRRARRAPRADVVAESRRIGRDQARLRRQVSDIIFARLGDGAEGSGEHFHGDGHGHDEGEALPRAALSPEALLKAAERAAAIAASPTDVEHDETPVVAINRPMLEAYNAMWDAGRALDVGEPARALPPMYAALAAIQRARAAERLYLRGAPPRVVVDLATVRLQGKDKGDPARRTPRTPLNARRQELLARLAGVLDLLEQAGSIGAGGASGGRRDRASGGAAASAAIDSLIVLRLATADRLPAAAAALEQAIDALRRGRDATAPLLRVRRGLDDGLAVADSLPAWGAWVR